MRKFGIMGVVASAALLGLAACGGGGEEAEAPAAPAAEAPAAEAPAAPAAEPAAAPAAPAAGATLQVAGLTGDAAAGQRIFGQCRTCHVVEPGVNRVGPSLHGVVGREAGTVPGYTYSAANLASDAVWDEQTLFTYLENPRGFMPGTKMAFVGLRDPQQRADVIAYLKTQA
ncbi:c-type cytochrome [Brevundimonas aurifodinae]|uniref:Cytochrome c family protein n=2 Tax=Brevundimonas TaxID=41275 RepID=A0ABV1NPE0_9CAUL|nr:MAG: cytochrome c family protein [Brevundimonas sp. 12-68-7]OYX35932.1 MAG: cytochrome c family protein [Brevundimonas subvibrioides]